MSLRKTTSSAGCCGASQTTKQSRTPGTSRGGTCLKKCFFETYRFSEDLDFTLADDAHLHEEFLRRVFADIAGAIYDRTGIEVPTDAQRFDLHRNPRGKLSCQARIAYRGPVSPRGSNIPRVKFDLTADELLVLPSARSRVFHPYSDEPPEGIVIGSYAYEEAFAEKTRALAERARPRDLYDVVNLFRTVDARPKPAVLVDVLRRKCAFKGIALPAFPDLEPSRPLLEGSWAQMLAHQLPMLPPFEPYSLRRTLEGNVILHAHNRDKSAHRSYRLDRIQGARVTNESFSPRFVIELTPSGPVAIAPTTTRN